MRKQRKAGTDPIAAMEAEALAQAINAGAAEAANETFATLLAEYLATAAPDWKGGLEGAEAVNHRSTFAKVPALLALSVTDWPSQPPLRSIPTSRRRTRACEAHPDHSQTRRDAGSERQETGSGASCRAVSRPLCWSLQRSTGRTLGLWPSLSTPRPGPGCRSGATWSEIREVDGRPTWIIPAAKMKMERDYRTPLTAAALALLGERGAADD